MQLFKPSSKTATIVNAIIYKQRRNNVYTNIIYGKFKAKTIDVY